MKVNIINWSSALRDQVQDELDILMAQSSPTFDLLKSVARESAGLPIYTDFGGSLILTLDGKVRCVEFGLDEEDVVTAEFDGLWFDHAWASAYRKYPEVLRTLQIERINNS